MIGRSSLVSNTSERDGGHQEGDAERRVTRLAASTQLPTLLILPGKLLGITKTVAATFTVSLTVGALMQQSMIRGARLRLYTA